MYNFMYFDNQPRHQLHGHVLLYRLLHHNVLYHTCNFNFSPYTHVIIPSVMEQSQVRVREYHPMLVCCLHALLVHYTSARRCQILDAASPRTMHVVGEGEKCVAAARDALQLREPFPLLLRAQGRGHLLELRLPLRLLAPAALEDLAGNEEVDRIRLLCALHALLEGQREDAGVVPQPP